MFGEINNPFADNFAHIQFYGDDTEVPLEEMFLPYVNNITQAPNLMLNSNIPGTYIVKLSADGKK